MPESRLLFGVRFAVVNSINAIKVLIENNSGYFISLITPNVSHICNAHRFPYLKRIFNSFDISICDSKILFKLAAILKIDLGCAIPGSDLVKEFFDCGFFDFKNVCIVGNNSIDINIITSMYPNINIFHINPSMGFIFRDSEIQDVVDFVHSKRPDFILLCVGSPQQEILCDRLKLTSSYPAVALCVGASIKFLAGTEKRAPSWFQQNSLEWLYRLISNPRRLWKRYVYDFPVLIYLFVSAIINKKLFKLHESHE